MPERQCKLGDDIHRNDTILDTITFDDIITALHCNAKVINRGAVMTVAREILESRIQDFEYLLGNNANEIIAEAAKGRG